MIIDITGIQLIPGNGGADCPGSIAHIDSSGNYIECCCDECDYIMCCIDDHQEEICKTCTDGKCPRAKKKNR